MEKNQGRILGLTTSSHALMHIYELSLAALILAIATEFKASLFAVGVIANVFALTFGFAALPAGVLADRFGSRNTLLITWGVATLASLLVGFTSSLYMLAVWLGLLGLAIGLYHPAGYALITRGFPQPGLALAYHGMAGSLGVALSPFLAGIIAAMLGWRAPFIIYALPALLLMLVACFSSVQETSLGSKHTKDTAPAAWGSLRPTLLPLTLTYLVSLFHGFIYRGGLTFLPAYLQQRLGFHILGISPEALAASMATLALLVGILGQYAGGILSDKVRLETLFVAFSAAVAVALVFMANTDGAWLLFSTAFFAFFNFFGQPVGIALLAKYTPLPMQGRSLGIFFLANGGIGSFSASFSGQIADVWGLPTIYFVQSIFGFLALLLAILLFRYALSRQKKGLPASGDKPPVTG